VPQVRREFDQGRHRDSFDLKAARIYASLRGDRKLKAPDALQLSCAASVGVDLFIANDERLQRERVAGVQFIVSLDRAPSEVESGSPDTRLN